MGSRRRVVFGVILLVTFIVIVWGSWGLSWDGNLPDMSPLSPTQSPPDFNCMEACLLPRAPLCPPPNDYCLKLAYGRTYGTSTQLDYATMEFSKPLSRYAADTIWGQALAEVQVALLASYVVYYEGTIERVKRLNFRNGYELGWLPKGHFTFPICSLGVSPYLESGAGLSYVSETFRNSGSRWNWSLLGGFGLTRCLPGEGIFSLGVQWRHLSNGNMWGKGDELHNSNSGTDMIQGLASVIQRF